MKAVLKSVFTLEGLDGNFSGFSRGETWNGWECPLFEQSEASHILEALANYDGGAWSFISEEDAFGYIDNNGDFESFSSHLVSYDGSIIKAYGIGAFGWCWIDAERENELN
jgi:hypothetical protein